MQIRNAVLNDLPDILRILDAAKLALRACGVDQWQDGYPNADSVRADIENGTGRVLVENGAVIATAAVYVGHEATYDRICGGSWRTDAPVYGIIHRIAVAPQAKNKGAASRFMDYCAELARPASPPCAATRTQTTPSCSTRWKKTAMCAAAPFISRTARRASATSACCELPAFRMFFCTIKGAGLNRSAGLLLFYGIVKSAGSFRCGSRSRTGSRRSTTS